MNNGDCRRYINKYDYRYFGMKTKCLNVDPEHISTADDSSFTRPWQLMVNYKRGNNFCVSWTRAISFDLLEHDGHNSWCLDTNITTWYLTLITVTNLAHPLTHTTTTPTPYVIKCLPKIFPEIMKARPVVQTKLIIWGL